MRSESLFIAARKFIEDVQVSTISHLSHTCIFALRANISPQKTHVPYTIDLLVRGAPMPKWTVLKQPRQRCFAHTRQLWYSSYLLQISQRTNLSLFSNSVCPLQVWGLLLQGATDRKGIHRKVNNMSFAYYLWSTMTIKPEHLITSIFADLSST